jgi:hypothetical protein
LRPEAGNDRRTFLFFGTAGVAGGDRQLAVADATSAWSRVSPQGHNPCKSPVFRLYYQGICLLGACQALFFLRSFACYFAARGAFTEMAPLFMPSLVLEWTP